MWWSKFGSSYPFLCASVVILVVTSRTATSIMIRTTSSKAAKANRPTTTRTHLEKMFYVYDVGASRQTSRVRQGQERCLFVTLKVDVVVQSQTLAKR